MIMNHDNILVTLEKYDADYLRLKVYDRKHKSSGWGFLINQEKLAKAINEEATSYIERDSYSFLSMYKDDRTWCATLTTLKGDPDDLKGYNTIIRINESDFKVLMLGYETIIRWVQHPHVGKSSIKFRGKLPEDIMNKSIVRRAFVKALKNSFHWGRESRINIYRDGTNSFFFAETKGEKRGICGGLVRSTRTVIGKDGNAYQSVYYGVHT